MNRRVSTIRAPRKGAAKARRLSIGSPDQLSRRMVQLGFLLLFLFPLLPLLYQRLTYQPTADFASFLLPWDPLLALGNLLQKHFSALIIGAPLLLLTLSLLAGRSFCGWVCPLGTLMDLVEPLAVWRRKRQSGQNRPGGRRNSRWRYLFLAIALVGSLISMKFLGWFDPLVIFSRAATSGATNLLAEPQDFEHGATVYVSLIFLCILVLEFLHPRFWCRHLCPQGALLSLVSRFSLLNRHVSVACSNCGLCKRICPMNAIPQDAHDTDYGDCTFCLLCESACPEKSVRFGFGGLALATWQPSKQRKPSAKPERNSGEYFASSSAIPGEKLSRRQFLRGILGTAAGMAMMPLTRLENHPVPLRPPGSLPETEFMNVCIACQECIRVCPTRGLQPDFLQTGWTRVGTPVLAPRLGGCSLGISCDQLCEQVCPVGAILPVNHKQFKIGTARVDHSLCLAWGQGVKCLVCVESCHYHAATPFRDRVIINPERCVGCGFCESGCPVPGSAIHVFPPDTSTI